MTPYLDEPRTRQIRREVTPFGKVGEPVDVVGGIFYRLSDDSAYVAGTELAIDGGLQNPVLSNLPGRTSG